MVSIQKLNSFYYRPEGRPGVKFDKRQENYHYLPEMIRFPVLIDRNMNYIICDFYLPDGPVIDHHKF